MPTCCGRWRAARSALRRRGRRARARGAGGARARARRGRPRRAARPARRRPPRGPRSGRGASCCRAPTRRSASPMSRRWRPGLPAVGSRARTGPEEIAALGGGMLLVPPGDPDALVATAARLLADAGERRRLGRAARQTVTRPPHLGALPARTPWPPTSEALPVKPVLFVTEPRGAGARRSPSGCSTSARTSSSRSSAARSHARGRRDRRAPSFPHRRVGQREILGLARLGRFRAVVCGTRRPPRPARGLPGGPARPTCPSCSGARSGRTRDARRAASGLAVLRHVYRARRRGGHLRAPRERLRAPPRGAKRPRGPPGRRQRVLGRSRFPCKVRPPSTGVFIGEYAPGKRRAGADPGLARLRLQASAPRWCWSAAAPSEPGSPPPARRPSWAPSPRRKCATSTRRPTSSSCRRSPRRHFREPWGLVANEAMNQGTPVIATDAVGAAAGGLVRHERNGLSRGRRRARAGGRRSAGCTTIPSCGLGWAPRRAGTCAPTRSGAWASAWRRRWPAWATSKEA